MKQLRYDIEIPTHKTEKKEFSLGEKGLASCPACHSVYYKKSWHHGKNLKDGKKEFRSELCPACRMIKDKEFEGQLIIGNFPPDTQIELVRLIKNFGQRAFERDPMHRLIDIKKGSGSLTVTATENQLAVKLAKKIKEVFSKNKPQVKISYSPEPSAAVYIKIKFATTPIEDK